MNQRQFTINKGRNRQSAIYLVSRAKVIFIRNKLILSFGLNVDPGATNGLRYETCKKGKLAIIVHKKTNKNFQLIILMD